MMLHSLADLLLYARLSSAAYVLSDGPALDAILKTLGLDLLGVVRARSVECFVALASDRVILSYQGTRVTEDLSPAEIWADLDGDPVELGGGAVVHDGFYTDLAAAWPLIAALLPTRPVTPLPCYAVGHSLGGSRAHLTPLFTDCHVVSFGAPKVGNAAYWSDAAWDRSTLCRVVREHDFAPEWPLFRPCWPFTTPFQQSSRPFFWMRNGVGSLADDRPGLDLSVGDHSDSLYEMDLVRLGAGAARYEVG